MANRLTNLKLRELSLVDNPANKEARVTIFKRDEEPYWKRDFTTEQREQAAESGAAMPDGSFPIEDEDDLKNAIRAIGRAKDKEAAKKHIIRRARALDALDDLPEDWDVKKSAEVAEEIAKRWIDPADGAKPFTEFLEASMGQDRYYEVMQEVGPFITALSESLRSIAGDPAMESAAKQTAMRESVEQFMNTIRDKWPEVEEEIAEALTGSNGAISAGNPAGDTIGKNGGSSMSDDPKTVAALTKQVAELTKANADLQAKVDDLTKAQEIAKSDEVLKVGDVEVRKSAVGEATFAMMKAQQAEITKEREAREMAELKKMADDKFDRVPGTVDERAAMLKAMNGMDEGVRKSFEAVLTVAQELSKGAFDTFGHLNGQVDEGSAEQKLEKLAENYAKEHKVSKAAAYDEVLKSDEGRKLYRESISAANAA